MGASPPVVIQLDEPGSPGVSRYQLVKIPSSLNESSSESVRSRRSLDSISATLWRAIPTASTRITRMRRKAPSFRAGI